MKEFIRSILTRLPFALTQNIAYDQQTTRVIKRVCHPSGNAIDVGCHKGEIIDILLKLAPQGQHFAFEPIPHLYSELNIKYQDHSNIHLFDCALAASPGLATFNHVISNPAYSGLKKRKYDRPNESDETIEVQVATLDEMIPSYVSIDLIKIDVEGAELGVLEGAKNLIDRHKPVIIFEHGLGAADVYGTTPQAIFRLLHDELNMNIFLMKNWLRGGLAMSLQDFQNEFQSGRNYYFLAAPIR